MPCPTSDRITEKPSSSTRRCTAWDTSPRRWPTWHCSTASKSDARVVASSRVAIGVTLPIGCVIAPSATQPSSTTPTSTESTSPRFSA